MYLAIHEQHTGKQYQRFPFDIKKAKIHAKEAILFQQCNPA